MRKNREEIFVGEGLGNARQRRRRLLFLYEFNAVDGDIFFGMVVFFGVDLFYFLNRIHSVRHFAEVGVLAVQERSGLGSDDEKLRAVGVGTAVCHGDGAFDELARVDFVVE